MRSGLEGLFIVANLSYNQRQVRHFIAPEPIVQRFGIRAMNLKQFSVATVFELT